MTLLKSGILTMNYINKIIYSIIVCVCFVMYDALLTCCDMFGSSDNRDLIYTPALGGSNSLDRHAFHSRDLSSHALSPLAHCNTDTGSAQHRSR